MKYVISLLPLLLAGGLLFAQKKPISQIKAELEKSTNPPLYVKDVLKKKYRIDTVAVMSTSNFMGWQIVLHIAAKLARYMALMIKEEF